MEEGNDGLIIRPLKDIMPLAKEASSTARPEGLQIPDIEDNDPSLPTIMSLPYLTAKEFDERTLRAKAIILIGYATGTTPDRLLSIIKKRVENGVPVIILADNHGDIHGIPQLKYAAGSGALEVGAVLLQKINVRYAKMLKEDILKALDEGKQGTDLASYIEKMFAYKEGEIPPPPDWEVPERVNEQREIYRKTLIRIGMKPEEIEKELSRWEYGDKVA